MLAANFAHGAQPVPLIQPGAPGQAAHVLSPNEAFDISGVGATASDVIFMRGMIHHHAQAIEMSALLRGRTRRHDMQLLGRRIALSQADEIKMMKDWLLEHGEAAPEPHHDMMRIGDGRGDFNEPLMPGMLTPEQMRALAAAHGAAFNRLYLQGMIQHHQGALDMVDALLATPRAGQDVEVFTFATDIIASQSAEIARMRAMLAAMRGTRRSTSGTSASQEHP
jgi:uncharacterized protein (DUF305 family)